MIYLIFQTSLLFFILTYDSSVEVLLFRVLKQPEAQEKLAATSSKHI
jgi:hypothetical protein